MQPKDPKTEVSETQMNTNNNWAYKIPPFDGEDPETWFIIVNRCFTAAGVEKEEDRFAYVVPLLERKYREEVKDLVREPPSQPYTRLREELVKRLTRSQDEKTLQLLQREEIGDRRPSQFLRHLRYLGGNAVKDDIIRPVWLSKLPPGVRAILAAHKDLALEKIADLADSIAAEFDSRQILEASTSTHSASTQIDPSAIDAIISIKFAQLATSLKDEIATLRLRSRSPSPWRNVDRGRHPRSRSRLRPRSSQRTPGSGICFYHWKFGAEARKCTPPCSQGNQTGNRQ